MIYLLSVASNPGYGGSFIVITFVLSLGSWTAKIIINLMVNFLCKTWLKHIQIYKILVLLLIAESVISVLELLKMKLLQQCREVKSKRKNILAYVIRQTWLQTKWNKEGVANLHVKLCVEELHPFILLFPYCNQKLNTT